MANTVDLERSARIDGFGCTTTIEGDGSIGIAGDEVIIASHLEPVLVIRGTKGIVTNEIDGTVVIGAIDAIR